MSFSWSQISPKNLDLPTLVGALNRQGKVIENQFNQDRKGSVTYNPPSLNDGAGTTTTVTVAGAVLGDICAASFSLDLQGITLTSYVSAANVVSVRFQNESGGVLDLASGTLSARVFK